MKYQVYPNPAVSGQRTAFRVLAGRPGRLRIAVYTIAGEFLEELWDGAIQSPKEFVLHWDGLSRNGHATAAGVYLVLFHFQEGVLESEEIVRLAVLQ